MSRSPDPRVVIIDYGSGNLRSVAKAFERVAAEGASIAVSADLQAVQNASHIVLPGVGAFADCMRGLSALSGMREALERNVREKGKPTLGICVGMQMLFDEGHEHGVHKGLGWIGGKVVRISDQRSAVSDQEEKHSLLTAGHQPLPALKIPHMGWNDLHITARNHPLLAGLREGDHAYFVHSYHALCSAPSDVLATTDYGGKVTAVIGRENFWGTQFHPEKSQQTGLRLLSNFLKMRG